MLGTFTQDEIRNLRLFHKKVEELNDTDLIRNIRQWKISVKVEMSNGQITSNFPNEDQVKSLLMSFRFFYLNDEPTNFGKVANTLCRRVTDQESRNRVKDIQNRYNKTLNQPVWLRLDGHKPTCREVIDLWFNAHYFHTDTKKHSKLQLYLDHFGNMFKFLLLWGVPQKLYRSDLCLLWLSANLRPPQG